MSLKDSSALPVPSPTASCVTVDVLISSVKPGIKAFLADFLGKANLFGKIERSDIGITKITLQGPPKYLPKTLNSLKTLLLHKYEATTFWGDVRPVEEQNRLDSLMVEESEVDEISLGGSAGNEQFKKFREIMAQSFLIALMAVRKEKHITVIYGARGARLEVSSILTMDALIEAVEKKLNLTVPVKDLYCVHDSTKLVVTDVSDLEKGSTYYVTTVNDAAKKKVVDLEGFYEKLKTEEGLTDEQIEKIKSAFIEQRLNFRQIIKTGELALTDEELTEYGIMQGGLRTAILAVIRELQN